MVHGGTVEINLENKDNGVRVCVTLDGFTECGWVSSYHLVQPRANHLKRAIERNAQKVLGLCQSE